MTCEDHILAVIRERMEEKGVTQSELARHLSIRRQQMWASLNGNRHFTLSEFIEVCRILGLRWEDFYGFE